MMVASTAFNYIGSYSPGDLAFMRSHINADPGSGTAAEPVDVLSEPQNDMHDWLGRTQAHREVRTRLRDNESRGCASHLVLSSAPVPCVDCVN